MSPATDTTLVSSIILPTYKRPLEAPWPPAVGPIETLHLCAVRLSCLEKVGSAIYAACVSRANRSEETDHSNKWRSTFPDLPVSSLWLLCCSHAVCHSSRGCYSRFIYKGSGGKNGKMRLEGKRHIFSRSDGVVRLWPSRGEEYAAHTLRASGQGVGSFPD